jgi:hypothetical protein
MEAYLLESHKCLLQYQSTEELRRKAIKAICHKTKLWTQEEIDLAEREAEEISQILKWG